MAEPFEAFGYVNGKLYFGPNHLQVATQAFEGGDIDASQLPTKDYLQKQGAMAFGWIIGDTVKFYSWDHQQFNEKAFAEGSDLFDKVFHQIQKKYPDVTEMTMGPD